MPNLNYEGDITFKLALFKHLGEKVHPTLIIQELQATKYIKQHNIVTNKLIEFIKLST
jgi:hypothetical protein